MLLLLWTLGTTYHFIYSLQDQLGDVTKILCAQLVEELTLVSEISLKGSPA